MKRALRNCSYPDWTLTKGAALLQLHNYTDREKGKMTCHVNLPYIKGLSEELHRIFRDHWCSTSFKPGNTLRQLLVSPKDPVKKQEICGAVYRINSNGSQEDRECHNYVGETGRMLKTQA